MIYCVVKKARNVLYGDVTDCMSKLVELVTYHKSKGGVFDITYNKGGRLETLHWLGSISSLFIEYYDIFLFIDGTHKTNIYFLSLVVTNVVDFLVSQSCWVLITLFHHQLRDTLIS